VELLVSGIITENLSSKKTYLRQVQLIVTLLMTAEDNFNFLMPGELLEIRRNRFEGQFMECCNLLYYFGINKITYVLYKIHALRVEKLCV